MAQPVTLPINYSRIAKFLPNEEQRASDEHRYNDFDKIHTKFNRLMDAWTKATKTAKAEQKKGQRS